MTVYRWAALAVVFALNSLLVASEPVTLDVGFDRWMYPFNVTPGSRASGSSFGAVGSGPFDDRDAQLIFGFDTSSVVLPADQELMALRLHLTTAGVDTFVYDPTVDSLNGEDLDEGRPLELYGVGVRNGFMGLTLDDDSVDPLRFKEDSPFSVTPGLFKSSRSAFAADHNGNDVSNDVSENQESNPWAIGESIDLVPGSRVPIDTEFVFEIRIEDPQIAGYVDAGFASGDLFFALSSIHSASRQGPPTFPSFYLDADGSSLGQTAQLFFEFGPRSSMLGDFNDDGVLDAIDIDRLSSEVRAETNNLDFDVNDDGLVNADDRRVWVNDLRLTYFGDSDLNGAFDEQDIVTAFIAGKYLESDAGWAEGDWDGDLRFDEQDFVVAFQAGGYGAGPRSVARAVPEPTAYGILFTVIVAFLWRTSLRR